MSEAGLRRRVVKLVRNDLNGQVDPIETGATGTGVPDVELCLPGGVQVWLELKVHDLPSRSPVNGRKKLSHLRREQARWLRERNRRRGNAGLLVMARWPAGSGRREYALLRGRHAAWLFLEQEGGSSWRWVDFRARSVVPTARSLHPEWLLAAIGALAGADAELAAEE